MVKKQFNISRIIFAVSPVFLGLAILWNQTAHSYDTLIAIGAIILALSGVIVETLK